MFIRTSIIFHFCSNLFASQYGGFLGFILVVELGIAVSMYAYKDRLADGFDKGLENSMLSYGPGDPQHTIDFFWMQRKVNENCAIGFASA